MVLLLLAHCFPGPAIIVHFSAEMNKMAHETCKLPGACDEASCESESLATTRHPGRRRCAGQRSGAMSPKMASAGGRRAGQGEVEPPVACPRRSGWQAPAPLALGACEQARRAVNLSWVSAAFSRPAFRGRLPRSAGIYRKTPVSPSSGRSACVVVRAKRGRKHSPASSAGWRLEFSRLAPPLLPALSQVWRRLRPLPAVLVPIRSARLRRQSGIRRWPSGAGT